MTQKRKSTVNEGIQATNIHAEAIAVGKGAHATVNKNMSSSEINQVFVELEKKVADLPDGSEKEIAKSAVNALKAEANLGEKAKEESVAKWLNFLAQMAPDIWEVAIASFANPVAGLGVAFQKVAQRARDEKANSAS